MCNYRQWGIRHLPGCYIYTAEVLTGTLILEPHNINMLEGWRQGPREAKGHTPGRSRKLQP